jgi:hypothetical protein
MKIKSKYSGFDQWRTQDFFFGRGGGGVQQIQFKREDGENGDMRAVAP